MPRQRPGRAWQACHREDTASQGGVNPPFGRSDNLLASFLSDIGMAKSDSFFIRAELTTDEDNTFRQTTIPLGSYVDALGQAVLRIHNIEYEWINSSNLPPICIVDTPAYATAQVTTQSQTSMTNLADKSVVFKSQLWARNPDGNSGDPPSQVYNDSHAPQHFSDGYLVAVETMYLGGYANAGWASSQNLKICMVLECTVEKMSQSAAMALALSQQ